MRFPSLYYLRERKEGRKEGRKSFDRVLDRTGESGGVSKYYRTYLVIYRERWGRDGGSYSINCPSSFFLPIFHSFSTLHIKINR